MSDSQALAPMQGGIVADQRSLQDALELFGNIQGKTTAHRLIEILITATKEGKIHWFRDAEFYAVTYIPMLAVSFRLARSQLVKYDVDPTAGKPQYLDVAFMDNKDIRLLGSQYDNLKELVQVVFGSFEKPYKRDRNERLEWLEKALLMFLPYVKSSSVEEE